MERTLIVADGRWPVGKTHKQDCSLAWTIDRELSVSGALLRRNGVEAYGFPLIKIRHMPEPRENEHTHMIMQSFKRNVNVAESDGRGWTFPLD